MRLRVGRFFVSPSPLWATDGHGKIKNMEIEEITNKETWENFLLKCGEKTFLDSWNWGEFQKKEGNKIWRFGILDPKSQNIDWENLVGAALIVEIQAKRGAFLFLPHSPSIAPIENSESVLKREILKTLVEKLKQLARDEKASFIRISPIIERKEENVKNFKDLGFREAPIHMHPEISWELDINSVEEDLLAGMRKTTRYLIKQAQKNRDIQIIKSSSSEDLKIFNQIYQETARRHKFVPFSLGYLENEFSSFKDDNQITIFLGKYQNKVVSSAIIVYWQNIGFYHHGASLSEYNKIPVSYLLQWEAIKEAKRRNYAKYNFWGITPDEKKGHPWQGLTLFKMGFGGYKKEYVKTQDLVLSKEYWLNYLIEKIRKIRRNL